MKTNKRLASILTALQKRKRRPATPETDRARRTRLVYVLLSIGTVVTAYLLVLLNLGVFSLVERGLYDKPDYESVTVVSAGAIADPLSRAVRVELYRNCTMPGDERAPLPEERSKADAIAQVKLLWEQTITLFTDANDGTLLTGESADRILRGSKYVAHLQDFYNEQNDTKIAIWGAQAYYTTASGRVYCLSAELDSRTNDVYSITVALFDSIPGERDLDFYPMLDALGEPRSVIATMTNTQSEAGEATTLTLSDGIRLSRYMQPGVQYYLRLD